MNFFGFRRARPHAALMIVWQRFDQILVIALALPVHASGVRPSLILDPDEFLKNGHRVNNLPGSIIGKWNVIHWPYFI